MCVSPKLTRSIRLDLAMQACELTLLAANVVGKEEPHEASKEHFWARLNQQHITNIAIEDAVGHRIEVVKVARKFFDYYPEEGYLISYFQGVYDTLMRPYFTEPVAEVAASEELSEKELFIRAVKRMKKAVKKGKLTYEQAGFRLNEFVQGNFK